MLQKIKTIIKLLIKIGMVSVLTIACSKGSMDGNVTGGSPLIDSQPSEPVIAIDSNIGLDVRSMATAAQSYSIYYGGLDDSAI